jgi:two-component system, chemotaxis family, chemotaxis protein CheY
MYVFFLLDPPISTETGEDPIGLVLSEVWPIRILVAEDEYGIAKTYEIALSSRGHSVTITTNGRECASEYQNTITTHKGAFDLVILDYRMPVMDGYEAAEKILGINPAQRIIFASAYAMETLVNLIKENGIIAEILQKPFDLDVLIDCVEDKVLYSKLEKLKIAIGDLKQWHPSHQQLSDLLDALLRLKDPNVVFNQLSADKSGSVKVRGSGETQDESSQAPDEIHAPTQNTNDDSKVIDAILQNALKYLGPDWLAALHYHLERMGVSRDSVAKSPMQFNKALDNLLGSASTLVRAQILKEFNFNQDLVRSSTGLSEFMNCLVSSDNSRTTTPGTIQRKGIGGSGGIAV